MRFVWLVFAGLVAVMLLVLPRLNHPAPTPAAALRAGSEPDGAEPGTSSFAALRTPPPGLRARADSVVAFGLAQRGTPYVYAGTSPVTGFDCSGFIMYTFAHFGVAVPHSTALLIDVGRPVPRAEAQPGDIVVFTGTDRSSSTPGHAGIVISRPGETPLRFVHASSSRREPFVKINQVEGSDYERRFMQVRRVLGVSALAAPRPTTPAPVKAAPALAVLPAKRVRVVADSATLAPLPKKLAPRKATRHATAKASAPKTVAKKRVSASKARAVTKKKAPAKPKRTVARKPVRR